MPYSILYNVGSCRKWRLYPTASTRGSPWCAASLPPEILFFSSLSNASGCLSMGKFDIRRLRAFRDESVKMLSSWMSVLSPLISTLLSSTSLFRFADSFLESARSFSRFATLFYKCPTLRLKSTSCCKVLRPDALPQRGSSGS